MIRTLFGINIQHHRAESKALPAIGTLTLAYRRIRGAVRAWLRGGWIVATEIDAGD